MSTPPPPSLLRSLAECPICYEIPRDLPVFLCVNSHSICQTCLDKLGGDAISKCPQGGCPYPTPRMRSRTVEQLVANADFEFPCKFARMGQGWGGGGGCPYKSTRSALSAHESVCPFRRVPCPAGPKCHQVVPIEQLPDHFKVKHKDIRWKDCPPSGKMDVAVMMHSALRLREINRFWTVGFQNFDAQMFVTRFEKTRRNSWCAWIVVIGGPNLAESYESRIELGFGLDKGFVRISHAGRVYPVDMSAEAIIDDPQCLEVNDKIIGQCLEESSSRDLKQKSSDSSDGQTCRSSESLDNNNTFGSGVAVGGVQSGAKLLKIGFMVKKKR